jgi:hypothetical protein
MNTIINYLTQNSWYICPCTAVLKNINIMHKKENKILCINSRSKEKDKFQDVMYQNVE